MAIEVQTTQNVVIEYEPAGISKRMLAYLIDWAFIIAWLLGAWGLWLLIGYSRFVADSDLGIVYTVAIIFPAVFYDLLFEYFFKGQSLGKKLMKIRVVSVDGSSPSFGSFLMRWLFRLVDFSITYYIVGVITILASKKSQRLGDVLAKTTVISMKMSAKNRLTLVDLDFQDNYILTFPDVLLKLSDRDIQTIVSIIDNSKVADKTEIEGKLANKVKQIAGYNFDGSDARFLRKVVDDYNYMALQE